jgi:electron transport complex protein RnfB
MSNLPNFNPKLQLAQIREAECIGCTKCIKACPVDAIVGSAKLMHTVIREECIGCGLCVPPCPVDCIDLRPIHQAIYDSEKALSRYHGKRARLMHESKAAQSASPAAQAPPDALRQAKKAEIAAAVARVRAKKQSCNIHPNYGNILHDSLLVVK